MIIVIKYTYHGVDVLDILKVDIEEDYAIISIYDTPTVFMDGHKNIISKVCPYSKLVVKDDYNE